MGSSDNHVKGCMVQGYIGVSYWTGFLTFALPETA